MPISPWKLALHFIVPGGLLAAAALAAFALFTLPPAAQAFLPFYPLLVLLLGLFLGWRFNRSRLLFALLVLLLADRTLVLCAGGAVASLAHASVAVLLPLNLALIAHYDERGLFTPLGLLRLGTILLQPVALAFFARQGGADTLPDEKDQDDGLQEDRPQAQQPQRGEQPPFVVVGDDGEVERQQDGDSRVRQSGGRPTGAEGQGAVGQQQHQQGEKEAAAVEAPAEEEAEEQDEERVEGEKGLGRRRQGKEGEGGQGRRGEQAAGEDEVQGEFPG